MKLMKVLAAVLLAAFLMTQAGVATGAGSMGDPPKPGGDPFLPPEVAVEEQGKGDPAQSLGDLLGLNTAAGRKSLTGGPGEWTADKDYAIPGPLCLEAGASVHLAGHKLTVYGDFTISDNLYLEKGSVIVSGNLIVDNGLLVMTSSQDYVQVGGSMIANGRNHTNCLTAGRLKVFGDFLQEDDYSAYSWNTSGTHVDEFSGTNKLIQFHSPRGSAFANPVFLAGTSFTTGSKAITVKLTYVDAGGVTRAVTKVYPTTGGSYLSISKALTADYSITAPNLYYMGAQGNWKLTVNNGNLIVPPGTSSSFTGSVSAKNVFVAGSLALATPGKSVSATGLFGVYGSLQLTAGSITAARFEAGSFTAEGDPGAPVTLSRYTADEISLAAPIARCSGNLAGRRLNVQGDLAVPAGQALDVGGGRISAGAGMTVLGALVMDDHRDTVFVHGMYRAAGESSAGKLTDGFLVLYGGFDQSGDPSSFQASGAHRVLLCGSGAQAVAFADPAGSAFANLYVLNGAVTDDAVAAMPCAGEKVRTSTELTGLGLAGGIPLYPAFDGRPDYEAAVPRGVDAVTVSPVFRFPNQSALLYAGDEALPGLSVNVPETGAAAVAVEVISAAGQPYPGAGAPFSRRYGLALQPQNPELASPGMAYATDRPFSGDVTDYAVTVPVRCETFGFSPVTANPNASFRFVCGGVETPGPTFTGSIAEGETVAVDVTVTAYGNPSSPDPVTQTYRFTFRRQTLLDGIRLSAGSLNEPFDAQTLQYTADVPPSVWSVTVTPEPGGGCASCAIGGSQAASADLLPPVGGAATAQITLADETGTFTRTYTLTVRRGPLLTDIELLDGSGGRATGITPAFSSAVGEYRAWLPVDAGPVTVRAARAPGCAEVQPDNLSVSLTPQDDMDILFTASAGGLDEQKAVYRLRVSVPLLISLVPSAGALDAPFSPDPGDPARVVLPATETSVTLTPVCNDGGAGIVTVAYLENGSEITGPSANVFSLARGQTRRLTIRAACGDVVKEYTVDLYRELSANADLKSLGASAGWLSKPFDPAEASHTIVLPETIGSVTFRPAVADAYARYRIDTLAANMPRTVSVALNNAATVKIAVTAQNGTVKTYTVKVVRKPMILAYRASPAYAGYPSLSPGGTDRLTFQYTVSLAAWVKIEIRKNGYWYAIMSRSETGSGAKTFVWDGKVRGVTLAAGTYSARLTAVWAGKAGTTKTVTVKILPKPTVTIPSLSPSVFRADGANRLTAAVKWTRLCDVRVDVVNGAGAVVRTIYSAANLAPAAKTVYWDGKDAAGELAPAGTYRVKAVCGGAAAVYRSFSVTR